MVVGGYRALMSSFPRFGVRRADAAERLFLRELLAGIEPARFPPLPCRRDPDTVEGFPQCRGVPIVPAMLALALAIIAFAAAFHAYWALGGEVGYAVSLPQRPDGTPVMPHRLSWWRPAAGGVALCLVFLAVLLLARAGHVQLPLPRDLVRVCLLVVGAAFVCRALLPNRYVGFF